MPAPIAARKVMKPFTKLMNPCSMKGVKNLFHSYGSPCKSSSVIKLRSMIAHDLKQIIILAAGISVAQGRRSLMRKNIQIASQFYFKRYKFLPTKSAALRKSHK